ncbi:hypothetical protein ACWDYJ_31370 [Streptomyces sp. NPDC003042]
MNVSREPSAAPNASAVSLTSGLLAIAVSLISVALTCAEGLGVAATVALFAAELVLVAAIGALFGALRPEQGPGRAGSEPSQRLRDEQVLDALEPMLPASGSGSVGGER